MANHAVGEDPLVGQTLGHYRIIKQIGSGGMGVVYRAHDDHLDREVAIKMLRPGTLADESSRKHFRKEALALSKLNHPNIATIHDFDIRQDVDFLVMEYISGVTLNDKLAEASMPEKQVVSLGVQLAEGLSAAHEHAVVHRDLKPGNLRITTDGRVKILDFGLAKLRASAVASPASETLSETFSIAGTLPYMAPEQVLGAEIDARTDIHAAGAVLYEMATGQRAFPTADRSHLTAAILRSSPRPAGSLNPRLSPELSCIIGKCLERDPEDRLVTFRGFGSLVLPKLVAVQSDTFCGQFDTCSRTAVDLPNIHARLDAVRSDGADRRVADHRGIEETDENPCPMKNLNSSTTYL